MEKEGYFWWISRSLGFPSEKRKLLRKFRSINSQKYKLIEAPKMGTVAVEIVFCRITRRVKEKRENQVKGLNFSGIINRPNQLGIIDRPNQSCVPSTMKNTFLVCRTID